MGIRDLQVIFRRCHSPAIFHPSHWKKVSFPKALLRSFADGLAKQGSADNKVILRWQRKGVGLRGFRQETESSIDDSEDEDILKVFRKEKVDGAIDEAVSRVLGMVDFLDAHQQYHRMLERY
ncbi:hypothetical protein LWI28_008123 [Acer negundo]|uniref:Uncharacterized protein n=1 Tax=Acer negundo TaxID=4023 RepID=A0AAD5NWS6_ACENE|nr:hypothetical protein LWI28_004095 [Acer negundo]KAI9185524.1 hypothetical protein LWI28_008123 [Acer negundo]